MIESEAAAELLGKALTGSGSEVLDAVYADGPGGRLLSPPCPAAGLATS
jgi:hypothetical protein